MKLLKFYTPSCGQCKAQERLLEGFEIEVVPVNCLEETELSEKYSITGLPTTVLLDDDDNRMATFVGIVTPLEIRQAIDNINYEKSLETVPSEEHSEE